jgi:hypothetical protein
MNIIEQQDKLKSAPDDSLKREMQSPSGMFPQYLVMTEIQRREKMRKDYEGRQAADNKTPPRPSMAEEMAMTPSQPAQMSSGIGSLLEQPQQPQIPPQMQQEPVRMNVGMQVPYSANNPYASFLIQDDPLTPEDESESEYMKAMREYYEERNKLMPEKLEKERRFRGGLDLVKAGLAVGTSATGAELNKNLSGVIDSISKTNEDLRKAEDKMSKEQLEFSKAKAIEQGRKQELAGKAGKFEQDEERLKIEKESKQSLSDYYKKDPALITLANALEERDVNQDLPIYDTEEVIENGIPKEIKVLNQDKLLTYASQKASSPVSQGLRQTGLQQTNIRDTITLTMNSVPIVTRIKATQERLKITEDEARAIVRKEVIKEILDTEAQLIGMGLAEGGLISSSVDSFNDVIQNING